MDSILAGATAAKKLQLVVEIGVSALFCDLAFEIFNGTADVEYLDGTAVAADEIILMIAFPEAEVCRPAVKANPTNDPLFLEPRDETIDRSGITRDAEIRTAPDFLESEWLACFEKHLQTGFERARFSQPFTRALFEERVQIGSRVDVSHRA